MINIYEPIDKILEKELAQKVEKFKEYFRDYAGQYTFIGGTACAHYSF